MIFAPQDAPAAVAGALADISDCASGKTIEQMLELVAHRLDSEDKDGDQEMLDSEEIYDEGDEGYDEYDEDDEDEEYFPDDEIPAKHTTASGPGVSPSAKDHTQSTAAFRQKIRSDLRVAKEMGFKVGHVGGLLDGYRCYVSLSCRISKLGISREAMKAWHVEPSEYFVVILQYPYGYKSIESIVAPGDASTAQRYVAVRIGVCTSYRPTSQEAIDAFTTLNKEKEKRRDHASETKSDSFGKAPTGFRNCFISRPLNGLFDERFCSLLRLRYAQSRTHWDGIEAYFNDTIGVLAAKTPSINKYLKQAVPSADYPPMVTADHIQSTNPADHSLPLVAMQFALRHFVRCTEFCLICFTRLPDDIQALKPYVCDSPLCLYQYMSLGFGPSIEHEILTQPKVVDLLISFCYTSARQGKLKDFPVGLSLMVPPRAACKKDSTTITGVSPSITATVQTAQATKDSDSTPPSKPVYMTLNESTREMLFPNKRERCPVRTGQWIVLKETKDRGSGTVCGRHCRVEDTTFWPTVKLGGFSKCKLLVRSFISGDYKTRMQHAYRIRNGMQIL
jgi:ubiquitin-conjugating enzyme E2 Q